MKSKEQEGIKALRFLQKIAGKPMSEEEATTAWIALPMKDKEFTLQLYNMLREAGATEIAHAKAKAMTIPKFEILAIAENCMKTAMNILVNEPPLATAALFLSKEGMYPVMLDMGDPDLSHMFVRGYIMALKPDAAIIITDAYVMKGDANTAKTYRRGDAKNSPNRTEAIVVTAGSVHGILSILQPYHRDGSKIVFDPRTDTEKEPNLTAVSAFFGDAWDVIRKEMQPTKGETVH